ncbi:MAG: sulfatase-like hydrolase/transferase [Fuerstiella sp.]|nr:sulfatase-like hydrolase/transferase [Fuerstiella sp.]MCP4859175.1 sulfatase-like hydrolase/transferase [Fuerstiella sp.]
MKHKIRIRTKSIRLIGTAFLFALLTVCSTQAVGIEETPNILFILVDDQGYGDLERHGNPSLKTPNINKLHNESARFTNFHVSPSCAPSRCALMSGKHEFKSGVTHTIMPGRNMSLKTVTLADVLKSAGYVTGMFGKWHLGHDGGYRAENRGFDVAISYTG